MSDISEKIKPNHLPTAPVAAHEKWIISTIMRGRLMKTSIDPAWVPSLTKGKITTPAAMMQLALVLSLCAGGRRLRGQSRGIHYPGPYGLPGLWSHVHRCDTGIPPRLGANRRGVLRCRFAIACSAADATPLAVVLDGNPPDSTFPDEGWFRVWGVTQPLSDDSRPLTLWEDRHEPILKPDQPDLNWLDLL
ncbi:MAG: hypothetical protein HQL73_02505 [Magnetococcales bacterium]|nr:hypothetical protein [Magnetococcales bacterium]